MAIKRALISVSDKTGIVELARELDLMGVEIISTGGTAKTLCDAGLNIINISDVTGFGECLDGRVKTLHPKIHGGLLALRDNEAHMNTLKTLGIDTIDLVVVNLYPFRKTIEKEGVELSEAIENIDIGGPSMLRAAAKNYRFVTVVVDPSDYSLIKYEMKELGDVTENTKFKLSAKVFSHTAHYDALISNYLWDKAEMDKFPDIITLTYEKKQDLRYGENPHQEACYYREITDTKGTLANAKQLHGKELSFNNINDASAAIDILREFKNEVAAVAIKHANPCGVAVADNVFDAYMKAYKCDPVSIFGGIIALNREVDEKTAEEINKIFVEIVIAPSYSEKALKILMNKKNIRIMQLENIYDAFDEVDMKKVAGGLLIQDKDNYDLDIDELQYVTDKKPNESEMSDLLFAWKIVKHVKSNAIVIAKDGMTLGIGHGQVNRIWAAKNAIERSGANVSGSVMASDAFFPFDDVAKECAKAFVSAIIQPGGSLNDNASIDECNKSGISMVFTGIRHFKH